MLGKRCVSEHSHSKRSPRMTQYLAQCQNCKGMVNQLEQTAAVARCDRCKGEALTPKGHDWVEPHLQESKE